MPIYDSYKKRAARAAGPVADVFQYVAVPSPLRVQTGYILKRIMSSTKSTNYPVNVTHSVCSIIKEEFGRRYILGNIQKNYLNVVDEFNAFLDNEHNCDVWLSGVEFAFKTALNNLASLHGGKRMDFLKDAESEFNARCIEHGFGFASENFEIIRVDSQFLHKEVVKPSIFILNNPIFEGAQAYFLNAHEHYRAGKYQECIVECGKSVEAVMKAICQKRNWSISGNAVFSDLVKICFSNGIIDPIWRGHFENLEKLIKTGIPPARNIKAAHASMTIEEIPLPIISYVLHMTAATIVFLADAEKILPFDIQQ